uniref:Uncharacterized protein n=1 Tax=Anguilla anguilla TaxID=7936 RepID=A0A0E9SK55_ANGAN
MGSHNSIIYQCTPCCLHAALLYTILTTDFPEAIKWNRNVYLQFSEVLLKSW